MDTIKGAVKSKTVWFGMAIAALSWLQQALPGVEGLSPEGVSILGSLIGVGILTLRALTVESLSAKATPKE